MTVYIGLWLYVVIIAYANHKCKLKPNYFMWLAFTGMTILLGLRGHSVGEDTEMYLSVAKAASRMSWKEIFSRFPTVEWNFISYGSYGGYSEKAETLYMAYNKLVVSIFRTPQAVLLITAIITSLLVMKFIVDNVEQKNDIYLATYIYMCDAMYMSSFNVMRQVFALAIAAQSVNEIKNNDYKKAAIWIAVASGIHLSALVFVIVLLVYKLNNKRKNYKWLIVGLLALPAALPLITIIAGKLSPKYAAYLRVSYWEGQAKGTLLLWAIIVVAIIIMIRSKKNDNYIWWLVYMATIYIGIELIGMRLTVISRVALYFRIGLLLFLPSIRQYFDNKGKLLYTMGMLAILTISFFSYASSPARVYTLCF